MPTLRLHRSNRISGRATRPLIYSAASQPQNKRPRHSELLDNNGDDNLESVSDLNWPDD